jgi:hypothetical protein
MLLKFSQYNTTYQFLFGAYSFKNAVTTIYFLELHFGHLRVFEKPGHELAYHRLKCCLGKVDWEDNIKIDLRL